MKHDEVAFCGPFFYMGKAYLQHLHDMGRFNNEDTCFEKYDVPFYLRSKLDIYEILYPFHKNLKRTRA